jgi:mono/diheme cytochrome c family protein
VFQGVDGAAALFAYNAKDGKALWSYPTQDTAVAAPMSYAVDGEQYILVGVGRGGTAGLMPRSNADALPAKGRFLAFKLDAQVKLPPAIAHVDFGDPPAPVDRNAKTAEDGEKLFREYCVRCHSLKGVGNGRLPDLRRLPRSMYDGFESIVRDGAVESLGMPRFGHLVNAQQIAALKTYLLVEAEKDRALRSEPGWWVAIKRSCYEVFASLVVRFL